MIDLIHATKLYGPVIGVNDIDLRLETGAYGLLGPNGSGKTTFLNLVIGQLRPTLGRVRVFGETPWNNHDLFRRVGVCPAQEVLYANVSGFEWVEYGLKLQGIEPGRAARMAELALERTGMSDAMSRFMGGYSKGMRQRTKLAQAIAHDPELLVLDEPFNGLDPIGRHDITEFLREWRRNRSLILASHILHEVEAICPSFLLILSGRLLASGTADEMQLLMAGIPCDVVLSSDQPAELARLMIELGVVEAVRLSGDDVQVSTRDLDRFARTVPQAARRQGIAIHELRTPEDTLQSLFNTLIRLHRGELA
ncbi:MAG: ABC transporter ATP-binding protein [Planctomycetes bacterium]|nr:ABC transporter ATP-binding protein [Planctomycetota bacterium]